MDQVMERTEYELGDLFDADDSVIEQALRTLADADLLLAAIIINTQPIYPGADEQRTAGRLADLLTNSKSVGGAAQLSQVVFEVVRPWYILEAVAVRTEADFSGVQDGTYEKVRLVVSHIAALPYGAHVINAAINAEKRTINAGWGRTKSSTSLMEVLAAHSNDAALLAGLLQHNRVEVSKVVVERLVELGARDELDTIATTGRLGLGFADSMARVIIANTSHVVKRSLAEKSDLSFIYRAAAMSHLSTEEIQEIVETSEHENVKNSAREELLRRDSLS